MSGWKSLVVGIDFTPCSASALRQSIRIAARNQAALHVVHVIETLVVMDLEEALSPVQADVRAGLVRDAREAWPGLTGDIPSASALELEVEISNPVAAILRRVRERSADLLVLGTHSTSPRIEALARSRRRASERRGPASCWFAIRMSGPSNRWLRASTFRTPRAARAGRENGGARRRRAACVARLPRAVAPAALPGSDAAGLRRLPEAVSRRTRAALGTFCKPVLPEMAHLKSQHEIFDYQGHGAGIIEFVKQVDGDLVVLGTRGRTNLCDILLGSTAERVVRDAPCSILAVKPERFEHPLGR
jgi:universal stress protein E